jgi:hypothetical protein
MFAGVEFRGATGMRLGDEDSWITGIQSSKASRLAGI